MDTTTTHNWSLYPSLRMRARGNKKTVFSAIVVQNRGWYLLDSCTILYPIMVSSATAYSWRCDIFTPARAKDVRKKALISAISVNLSRYHHVRLFAPQLTVSFACGWGVILARYTMRIFYFTPERTHFAYAFLMSSTTWNQNFISVPLAEGEKWSPIVLFH